MSDKIKPHHLQRKAVLYIRQSSAYQVAHNQESRKLQYAMKGRLQRLGWTEIDIVDEDLGRSAAGTVNASVDCFATTIAKRRSRQGGITLCTQQPGARR